MIKRMSFVDKVSISLSRGFSIITDIEKYPEFVLGFKKVNVIERDELGVLVEIIPTIPIKNVIMRADFFPPDRVTFKQIEGPLSIFEGEWRFKEIDPFLTEVSFNLQYFVKNFIAQKLIYKFVDISFKDIIVSFRIRAKKLNF